MPAADGANSSAMDRPPRSPRSPDFRQPTIPDVATLLEFVAWVVFCEVPASARSANWFKGRGGYLADQLDAVREASIRVQASSTGANHWPAAMARFAWIVRPAD
jgi:hypothetical protein